jgi:bifunctional NMN adenylyltransferase/nudix hydrolase
MKETLTVYIGRFSPFHAGHAKVLRLALQSSAKVLVLIGSTHHPRTIKNPWTYEERRGLIQNWAEHPESGCLPAMRAPLYFAPLTDSIYDDAAWAQRVRDHVAAHARGMKVRLIGSDKDSSAYYLKMFPEWELDLVEPAVSETGEIYHSTAIREEFFGPGLAISEEPLRKLTGLSATADFLAYFDAWRISETDALRAEYRHIRDYKTAWAAAPYPPIFSTVDAVVKAEGKVLMIRRKNAPGAGLLALPGGFVNQNETLLAAAIRELREETGLLVIPEDSYNGREIFDAPGRSLRGRTITTAHYFELWTAPEVKSADDASWAGWIDLEALEGLRDQIYEDHFDIITHNLKD